jgi:hypothetical protein
MNDCVCGFNPPDDPNPDCERCQLVTEVTRLEGERDEAREAAKLLWQVAMYEMAYSPSALLAESPWLEDE